MAWLNNWSKRIKLIVDNTNVDGTLSDFPVLIKISNSSGISSTDVTSVFIELGSDANRKKIAVTTDDGTTQCYVEIERFDYANLAAWFWVKVPSVSSGDTTILYLYYDSDQAGNTLYVGDTTDAVAHNVWDENFVGVWHMSQDPNGDVANAIKDSTSNQNDGTPAGSMTSADLVDGKIGKAIDFDGNDYINIGDLSQVEGSASLTLEAIVRATSFPSSNHYVLGKYGVVGAPANVDRSFFMSIFSTGQINYGTVNADGTSLFTARSTIDNISTSTYYHIVGTTQAGTTQKIYINNSEASYDIQETFPVGQTIRVNDEPAYISKYGGGTYHWYGDTDEIRISNIARSAAWIKATYYSNWDGLISFGAEQTRYISGYVTENTTPVNRQIYLHNRDTGALIGSTTSSGVGGYFYMETTYSGAHYVVCIDDMAGLDYNDLIYGNIYPATVSG